MKKIRALLVSLLKPVNDTRMYEKMGRTLAARPDLEVHVGGYQAPVPVVSDYPITFHPIFSFPRLSLGRFLAQFIYVRLLFRVQPDLVVVGTHELLLASVLYKAFRKCRLVYDIRENYARNLQTQQVYPKGIRQVLAGVVRVQEVFCARFVHHFLLAEISYARELPFLRNNFTVVENKVARPQPFPEKEFPIRLPPTDQPVRLLFSGTLTPLFGVFEAVAFCQMLRTVWPKAHLLLIGHCPEQAVLRELREQILQLPYVTLVGGEALVPHHQILQAIRESDLGLLPYRPHSSTFACFPTKMYEYMGHNLPMVVQSNPYWEPLVWRHQAGLFLDFGQKPPPEFYLKLQQTEFYPGGNPQEVFWDQEVPAFWEAIESALRP